MGGLNGDSEKAGTKIRRFIWCGCSRVEGIFEFCKRDDTV